MRGIRRKIYFVVVMLMAAIGVGIAIYWRGGFSIARGDDVGYCGTIDPRPKKIYNPEAANGEILFKTNCTSCHAMDKELTGPAMIGVTDRSPYKNFIVDLLLNPKSTLRQSTYAQKLSKRYGDEGHMSFKGILTKLQIENIISYTKCSIPTNAGEQVIAEN